MCKTYSRITQEKIAKTLFKKLLRTEFDKYHNQHWAVEECQECIITARFYSLHSFADQMESDIKY